MIGFVAPAKGSWRIGELSRRVGVSPSTLRAWESRYGLLKPRRSAGNYRLYGPSDESRVRRLRALMEEGLSVGEAARAALQSGDRPEISSDRIPRLREELLEAFEAYDEAGVHEALDRLLAGTPVDRALREVVLPVLHELGERWSRGSLDVGEEHFGSNLIEDKLRALAAERKPGSGPMVVLACAPGELHSIGLCCMEVGLRSRGARVTYLGRDTPPESIERACRKVKPDLVVLSAVTPGPLRSLEGKLSLPAGTRLAIGGAGASAEIAAELGAELLATDPLSAAERLLAGG